MEIASVQHVGRRRRQEDSFGFECRAGRTVLALADGMGGHVGGNVASELAVQSAIGAALSERALDKALELALSQANAAVSAYVTAHPEAAGMGCTLVCAIIENNALAWASVGDSHLLFVRERLEKLNADHSMKPVLARMVESGEISGEQAASDGSRHMLRSAITGDALTIKDVRSEPLLLCDGDVVLLASDGIDVLSRPRLQEMIVSDRSRALQNILDGLLACVLGAGDAHQDNVTVIAARRAP